MNQIVIDKLDLNWFQKYKIKKKIFNNLEKHLYCIGNIQSTYHNDAFLHQHSEFKCLQEKINLSTNKIFKKNFEISSMWANVGTFGSKIDPHNHIEDKYSNYRACADFQTFGVCGAFYLKKPKLSGNFIANGNVIDIQEKDIIFFSPHVVHSTETNKSHQKRIVISFNGYLV